MRGRANYLLVGIFILGGWNSHLRADSQGGTKKDGSRGQILTANVDRSYKDGKPKNTFSITGQSNLKIKKATVISEGEDDSRFTVYLTTDEFAEDIGPMLVVQVEKKVFIPRSWGGDAKAYWSLELEHVDRASAEILNGGALPKAPKESFTIENWPHQKSYPAKGPVTVGITLTNVGQVPLTIFWGTTGGANYRCRDTQLSFAATLDGAKVPANPKPLPDGFISSPFTSKAKSALKRSVDLTEWLQVTKPGNYVIDATYTIEIMNPQEGVMPKSWKVSYHNQFSVRIEE